MPHCSLCVTRIGRLARILEKRDTLVTNDLACCICIREAFGLEVVPGIVVEKVNLEGNKFARFSPFLKMPLRAHVGRPCQKK